jgi:hypothetical protein
MKEYCGKCKYSSADKPLDVKTLQGTPYTTEGNKQVDYMVKLY